MNKTRRLVFIALFSALLGLISQLVLPLPAGIPLTLQTFAVALCGVVLGSVPGTVSVLVWLTLGAAGLPLFSGFRGGTAVLFGPSGGFLMGFLLLVLFCGLGGMEKSVRYYLFSAAGLLLCHLLGALWFSAVSGQSLLPAALTVSLPYLPKDLLSLVAARLCGRAMIRFLPFLRKK